MLLVLVVRRLLLDLAALLHGVRGAGILRLSRMPAVAIVSGAVQHRSTAPVRQFLAIAGSYDAGSTYCAMRLHRCLAVPYLHAAPATVILASCSAGRPGWALPGRRGASHSGGTGASLESTDSTHGYPLGAALERHEQEPSAP